MSVSSDSALDPPTRHLADDQLAEWTVALGLAVLERRRRLGVEDAVGGGADLGDWEQLGRRQAAGEGDQARLAGELAAAPSPWTTELARRGSRTDSSWLAGAPLFRGCVAS